MLKILKNLKKTPPVEPLYKTVKLPHHEKPITFRAQYYDPKLTPQQNREHLKFELPGQTSKQNNAMFWDIMDQKYRAERNNKIKQVAKVVGATSAVAAVYSSFKK